MNHKWIILGMMLVTMLPRIIPLYIFKTEKMPAFLRKFLEYIPFAVLGALILPSGLEGIAGEPLLSGFCLVVAGITAWFRPGILQPVMGAVLVAYLGLVTGVL
jgi:branched-subunit amino acid transport protein